MAMTSSIDPKSFHAGVRACIAWLHEEAGRMNDPHAKGILNSAAFSLGTDKPDPGRPSPPVRVDGVGPEALAALKSVLPFAMDRGLAALGGVTREDACANAHDVLSALNTRSPEEDKQALVRSPSASPATGAGSAMPSEGGE